MSIVYKNTITADEVNAIRKSMGWRQIHPEQQQANIDGNTLTIAAYKSETAVAMAGLRWNGGSFANMNIILIPSFQNKGIEKELVEQIFNFLREKLKPGFGIQVDMNVRSGQEALYESFGFIHATPENSGIPMRICLTDQIELTDRMFKQMEFRETPLKYVRIQGRETAYRTGMPVGIFAAVHRLQEAGLLTNEEKAIYHDVDQVWFQENLPNPPFYDDDKPGKPITWFKTATSGFMLEKLRPLMDMLEKYAKPYDLVYSNFPGRIVYEDEWQVAVYNDNAPGRISLLSTAHLSMYAEVIRNSFATVASDFNLTRENCPGHTSFITNERLASKLKDGYYPFGYFSDGKLVGFASLTDTGNGLYEMNDVSILPEYRHFGYGKALLDFCKDKIKEFDGSKITIGIVEENTVLKKWYAANGFVHTDIKQSEHLPFKVGYMEWELKENE